MCLLSCNPGCGVDIRGWGTSTGDGDIFVNGVRTDFYETTRGLTITTLILSETDCSVNETVNFDIDASTANAEVSMI